MSETWAPGAVTGIGSLPGVDPVEATALVFGELPDLPHLPELPDRGPGADMIGRSAALLVDLPVEIVPSGWRIAAHPGRDLRQARDHLARDLDALQDAGAAYTGPLKLQAAGPWTLAAALELPNGHAVVSDPGAARDLTQSLAEGVRAHLDEVRARVPGAVAVLQLDEPSLPAVLGGRVPTPSGYGTIRSVDPATAGAALRDVLDVAAAGARVVHCCAADVPIGLLGESGADALALDAELLARGQYDALGEFVEAGGSLWLGVTGLDAGRTIITRLWSELGFATTQLATGVVATPPCGLAGTTPAQARRALTALRDIGRWLVDTAAG